MIIDPHSRPEDLVERGLHWWSNERFAIGWKGHVYFPGESAGEKTVAKLALSLENAELATKAGDLRGVFGLFVWRKSDQSWQITVDNTGLYKIYFDRRGASTSFLDLVRKRGIDRSGVSLDALAQFLAYGAIIKGKTLALGIEELSGNEILLLGGSQEIHKVVKVVTATGSADATQAVREHFAMLAHSLQGRRLSVDATGGFDSRLVMSLLSRQELPFELAISGQSGTPDTEIARRIAGMLDR
ncbi:MAG: hypothetical protein AB7X49_18895, partial [Geminicoccaceae bacterium]